MFYHGTENQNGKTFLGILRRLALIAGVIFMLVIIGQLFWRVVFEDSAAEDTIKELKSRAISASSQMISGQQEIVTGEFGLATRRGYPVMTYPINGSFFEIALFNVPRSVCRRLTQKGWHMPTSIYVNGTLHMGMTDLCLDYNQIAFEFSRDLQENISNADKPYKTHCQTDSDCSGCEACRNGRCQTGCQTGEVCGRTLKGKDVCCSESEQAQGLCCSYIEDGFCCWGRGKCCPKNHPIRLEDGSCTDCYDSRVFAVGDPPALATCQKLCPMRTDFGSDALCALPVCRTDQFMGLDGSCHACHETGGILTAQKQCERCSNRLFSDGLCSLPCPAGHIADQTGRCQTCDTPESLTLTAGESCENSCPNREIRANRCVLKSCPTGFITDQKGNCLSCQTESALINITAEQCRLCPNRIYDGARCLATCDENTFRSADGKCIPCDDTGAFPIQEGEMECLKCPDRLALSGYCFAACNRGEFRDAFGACRSCADLNSYPVQQSAMCQVCPNRSVLLRQIQNKVIPYCMTQYCPMDYFADRMGSCHDCSIITGVINTTRQECEKCPNRMWSPVNQTCLLHPNCRSQEITDTFGKCRACDEGIEVIPVNGYESQCRKCTNRYLFGYWCRRCPTDVQTLKTREGCEKCGGVWDNRIGTCTEAAIIRKPN
ncbi:MAG: hypothetical protein IJV07_00895 [Alphaproteobacteria bacterium]|nr:hypothetical protein [Alphaproteobacteria bacterium]